MSKQKKVPSSGWWYMLPIGGLVFYWLGLATGKIAEWTGLGGWLYIAIIIALIIGWKKISQ